MRTSGLTCANAVVPVSLAASSRILSSGPLIFAALISSTKVKVLPQRHLEPILLPRQASKRASRSAPEPAIDPADFVGRDALRGEVRAVLSRESPLRLRLSQCRCGPAPASSRPCTFHPR